MVTQNSERVLESSRLILQKFALADTSFIMELVNSPGWLKFIGDRNVHTEEQAQTYLLHGPMKSYAENGYGLCKVVLKGSDMPVGMCGFIKRADLDHPDIGFAFLPEHEGQGYALEIASALMAYGKLDLGFSCVLAITVPHNVRSIRLLEKLGLKQERIFTFPVSDEELLMFRKDF